MLSPVVVGPEPGPAPAARPERLKPCSSPKTALQPAASIPAVCKPHIAPDRPAEHLYLPRAIHRRRSRPSRSDGPTGATAGAPEQVSTATHAGAARRAHHRTGVF